MRRISFVLTLITLLIVTTAFSNRYFEAFQQQNLHDVVLPSDDIQKAELIKITDAIFYSVSDEQENVSTLKLAGLYTECISTAKFCLREAANNFAQNLFLDSDDQYIYYQKKPHNNEALIWIKYQDSFYLMNLILLFNDFAFLEGESTFLNPYLERLNELEGKEETNSLNNMFGDSH